MNKRCVLLRADGSQEILAEGEKSGELILDHHKLSGWVGGLVEFVRILRADLNGFTFTTMIVCEDGLVRGLPRNKHATELYLANVRRQYPDAEKPYKKAAEAHREKMKAMGVPTVSVAPDEFEDDPHIVGDVIYFEGWTERELNGIEGEEDFPL